MEITAIALRKITVMKLLSFVKRVFNAIRNRYLITVDPVRYARSIGVNIKGKVTFYGASPGMFGSEPWLITLGDNVHIVSGCNFVTHDGGVLILRQDYPDLEITKPIVIGDNVYIGLNCTILPGVHIGDNVIVGAGSVVTRNVPSGNVVGGVPARSIKSLESYLSNVRSNSLGFGNLSSKDKAEALKKYYKIDKS